MGFSNEEDFYDKKYMIRKYQLLTLKQIFWILVQMHQNLNKFLSFKLYMWSTLIVYLRDED